MRHALEISEFEHLGAVGSHTVSYQHAGAGVTVSLPITSARRRRQFAGIYNMLANTITRGSGNDKLIGSSLLCAGGRPTELCLVIFHPYIHCEVFSGRWDFSKLTQSLDAPLIDPRRGLAVHLIYP